MSDGRSSIPTTLYCSFCGKSQHEVRQLIAAPAVFICDECVELCADLVMKCRREDAARSRDLIPEYGPFLPLSAGMSSDACEVLADQVERT